MRINIAKVNPFKLSSSPRWILEIFESLLKRRNLIKNSTESMLHTVFSDSTLVPKTIETIGSVFSECVTVSKDSFKAQSEIEKALSLVKSLIQQTPAKSSFEKNIIGDLSAMRKKSVLTKLSREYSSLPVFNKTQWLARKAGEYAGREEWGSVKMALEELLDISKSQSTWEASIKQYKVHDSNILVEYVPTFTADPHSKALPFSRVG